MACWCLFSICGFGVMRFVLIAELFAAVYLFLFYGVWYEFVWVGCGGGFSGLF